MNKQPVEIALELATLLKKYGGKLLADNETITFPSKKKQDAFMKEWMAGKG